MKTPRFFVVLFLFLFFGINLLPASEISQTLNEVQTLMKSRDFAAARQLLTKTIRTNQNSYKLWLALGYIYEAEEDFSKALQAFRMAGRLKTNIPGLLDRILRLQDLVDAKKAAADDAEKGHKTLLEKARYQIAFGKQREGFITFSQAVEEDRSILGNDYGLIRKGLDFFKKNKDNDPDSQYYLGVFTYYSGQYGRASKIFKDFINTNSDSDKLASAKQFLAESQNIIKQVKLVYESQSVPDKKPEKAQAKPAPQTYDESYYANTETSYPSTGHVQSVDGELLAVTMAKERVMALLEQYDREYDAHEKTRIIWRIGDERLPLPEVMAKFAHFLNDGSIETVFETLKALRKIGLPGAKACGPHIISLLRHEDMRIRYLTAQTLQQLPIMAKKAIPRLLKMYREEEVSARKGFLIRTFAGYGEQGIKILYESLEDALGVNKRPIAEVLNRLTGEDVETLIRNS